MDNALKIPLSEFKLTIKPFSSKRKKFGPVFFAFEIGSLSHLNQQTLVL